MSANAAGWRALTDAQRAGWESLAGNISRTDALGSTYTLNGFLTYVSVNNNNVAAGNAIVADAPALVTPAALLTAVITLTSAALSIAYTTTPLSAGSRLFTFASPQVSAGRQFNANYYLIAVSAAAAASPANLFAAYSAKWGVPVTGRRVFFSLTVYNGGFQSGPLVTSQIIA